MNIELLPIIELRNAKKVLSKNKGIYFWFEKATEQLVYIGRAVGTGGLKKRIVSQHLNPKYLEYRPEMHTSKDVFQLNHAIEGTSKDGKTVRKGIDKSAFRKSIGRRLELKPGVGTVNFIVENLYLKTYELEDIEYIKALETDLIGKYQPKFNNAHKAKYA